MKDRNTLVMGIGLLLLLMTPHISSQTTTLSPIYNTKGLATYDPNNSEYDPNHARSSRPTPVLPTRFLNAVSNTIYDSVPGPHRPPTAESSVQVFKNLGSIPKLKTPFLHHTRSNISVISLNDSNPQENLDTGEGNSPSTDDPSPPPATLSFWSSPARKLMKSSVSEDEKVLKESPYNWQEDIFHPDQSSSFSKRTKRHTTTLLQSPRDKRMRRGKRQKKRKKKKRKRKKHFSRKSSRRHQGRQGSSYSSIPLSNRSLHPPPPPTPPPPSNISSRTTTSNTPSDLDYNMTSVSGLITPIVVHNSSLVKFLTRGNGGKVLISGHEMFVTITQGKTKRNRNEKKKLQKKPRLFVDHELSVSVKSGNKGKIPEEESEITNTKSDLLSPLGMLNSHTLSWLPYNPNIRVSIQVVGDLSSSSSSSSFSFSSTTASPSLTNTSEDTLLHQHHLPSHRKNSSNTPDIEGGLPSDVFPEPNILATENPNTSDNISKLDKVNGHSRGRGKAEQNKRRKKFILTSMSDRNRYSKAKKREKGKTSQMKETQNRSNIKGKTNEAENPKQEREKDHIKKKRKNENYKKMSRNKDHKGHKKKMGAAAWELVSGLAAALEDLLLKSNLKSEETTQDDPEAVRMDDACSLWASCRVEEALQELSHLQALPSCPCFYPADLVYQDALYDPIHNKTFRWFAINGRRERIDVYQRGAHLCVRSRVLPHHFPHSLAAQTCCYNRDRRLITRGSGAGTPELVSPQVSAALHRQVDILPWLACHGNFLRYQEVRSPNNGQHCLTVPDDHIYQQQVFMATDY